MHSSACRGGGLRDPAGRTSIAQTTTNSSVSIFAQFSALCPAQRGAKTVTGFRARRTVAAQSSPQFSASCPPHCGSVSLRRVRALTEILSKRVDARLDDFLLQQSRAVSVARWDFISILLTAKRVKSLSTRAGDGIKFCPRARGKSCQNVPAHFDDFPS